MGRCVSSKTVLETGVSKGNYLVGVGWSLAAPASGPDGGGN